MILKQIIDEDFVNYREPSMYLIFPHCSFKCDTENKTQYCQNRGLALEPDIEISKEEVIDRYLRNPITSAIVCGGLEPFDSPLDLLPFIDTLRRQYECDDPVIIYTGYTEEELMSGHWGQGAPDMQKTYYESILSYKHIIIKYGRYNPNEKSHYDEVLGVNLASSNQYAKEY